MSINTVTLRGRELYEFMKANREPKTRPALKQAMGWDFPEHVFTGYLKEARRLAVKDGLLIPMAVYDNEYTYAVTGDPNMAVIPGLQLQAIAAGVKKVQYDHDYLQSENLTRLPKALREVVEKRLKNEAAIRTLQESALDDERKAIAALPASQRARLVVALSK